MTDLMWVLSSCVLILAVIAIRAAFGKRMRPGLRYALWGLVLLRLLYPGTVLSSPVSVRGVAEKAEVVQNFEAIRDFDDIEYTGGGSVEGYRRDALFPDDPTTVAEQVTPERFARMETAVRVRDVLEPLWRIGMIVTAVIFLASNLRFYQRLRKRRKLLDADCPLRVYSVENLSSSCLFGGAIYVAAETAADETRLRHVLVHELSHYRNGDHVWALLRCAALALHWYNPLVWWAAALSRQDSELCADAGALKRLGEEEYESYGATLIELSARRAPKASLLCTATTMTNGRKSLKERVTMIARRPRMTATVVCAVVLIAVVAAGCAFTGAVQKENEAITDETQPETEQSTFRFYGDGWYLDAPYTIGEGEDAAELTHTVRDTVGNGLFYVFRAGEDAAMSVEWEDTPASVWFDPEISHWDEGFTLDPERRIVTHEYNGEQIEDYYVDAPDGCYVLSLGGTKHRDELWAMAESFTIDPSARAVIEGSERLRGMLARLSPADVHLTFHDYDGVQGGVDGASALVAADYLASFGGIEWIDDNPMNEDSRAGDRRIELDTPDWRLTSYEGSRKVLVETGGEELWLIARNIPDTQYSWHSFDMLANWYWDALAAETHRGPQAGTPPNNRPLTGEELTIWREELATMRDDKQTVVSCFFTSSYSDPRDLDFFEFLYYCPLGEIVGSGGDFVNIDEAELSALIATGKYFGDVVPTHRYRVSKINAALTQYAGVTLDDLHGDWKYDERMLYLPEYDAFYNFTSDFGPGYFYPRYGERRGNAVTLWSDNAVVEIVLTGDEWQIQAHMANDVA